MKAVVWHGIVDFEPIIPGHINPEQAEHYAQALTKGQPNAERIGLTLFRDTQVDTENRAAILDALAAKAPALLAHSELLDEQQIVELGHVGEPEESLRAQREGAPECPH